MIAMIKMCSFCTKTAKENPPPTLFSVFQMMPLEKSYDFATGVEDAVSR